MMGTRVVIIAVSLAYAASSALAQLTQGTQSCDLPDFLSEGFGPVTSEVNRNKEDPNQQDHRELIKRIDDLEREKNNYVAWYNAVRGCYANPDFPVWYEVDWKCLINTVTGDRCNVDGFDCRQAFRTGVGNYWIYENAQYYYQCGFTCQYWISGGGR